MHCEPKDNFVLVNSFIQFDFYSWVNSREILGPPTSCPEDNSLRWEGLWSCSRGQEWGKAEIQSRVLDSDHLAGDIETQALRTVPTANIFFFENLLCILPTCISSDLLIRTILSSKYYYFPTDDETEAKKGNLLKVTRWQVILLRFKAKQFTPEPVFLTTTLKPSGKSLGPWADRQRTCRNCDRGLYHKPRLSQADGARL